MNLHHHPTAGSAETCLVRANNVARARWKQAAWGAVIVGLTVFIVGRRGDCRELPDFATIEDTDARKTAFIEHLAPMVERANEEIVSVRTRLLAIDKALGSGMVPGPWQRGFVQATARRYGLGVITEVDHAAMVRLLGRADVVPVSLVVAQAAIESGWGTSRFARRGNNLFGMRDYARRGGMVPRDRAAGAHFEIMVFSDACDAVRAYMQNLNTDPRYRDLRVLREQLRASGSVVSGERLADGLTHYSSRGDEYVADVKGIIATNNLGRFDTEVK